MSNVYYVNLSPLVLSITAAYSPDKWSSSNTIADKDENGNPFFTNEELIAIFKGEGIPTEYGGSSYPATLITRNKNTGDYYVTAFVSASRSELPDRLLGHISPQLFLKGKSDFCDA